MGMFNFLKKKPKEGAVSNGDTGMPQMPSLPDIPQEAVSVADQASMAKSMPELPKSQESTAGSTNDGSLPYVPTTTDQLSTGAEPMHEDSAIADIQNKLDAQPMALPELHEESTSMNQAQPMPTADVQSGDEFELPSFNTELASETDMSEQEELTPLPDASSDSFDFALDTNTDQSMESADSIVPETIAETDSSESLDEVSLDIPTSFDSPLATEEEIQSEEQTPSFSSDEDITAEIQSAPDHPHYVNLDVFEEILQSISQTKSDAETSLDIGEELGNTNSKLSKSYDELHSSLLMLHKKLQSIDKVLFKGE